MTTYDASSRCSGPSTPTFRWYGYPTCEVGADITTAVDVLFEAVKRPGRVWNPYAAQMARSEFKKRIERAEKGKLRPVEEVKPVDVQNPPPLYEIRWQAISVTEVDADGKQSFGEAVVRMYHSEPSSVPGHFVGHHAHEKDLSVDDVNQAQQQEIKTAIGWHDHGVSHNWGIASA